MQKKCMRSDGIHGGGGDEWGETEYTEGEKKLNLIRLQFGFCILSVGFMFPISEKPSLSISKRKQNWNSGRFSSFPSRAVNVAFVLFWGHLPSSLLAFCNFKAILAVNLLCLRPYVSVLQVQSTAEEKKKKLVYCKSMFSYFCRTGRHFYWPSFKLSLAMENDHLQKIWELPELHKGYSSSPICINFGLGDLCSEGFYMKIAIMMIFA